MYFFADGLKHKTLLHFTLKVMQYINVKTTSQTDSNNRGITIINLPDQALTDSSLYKGWWQMYNCKNI